MLTKSDYHFTNSLVLCRQNSADILSPFSVTTQVANHVSDLGNQTYNGPHMNQAPLANILPHANVLPNTEQQLNQTEDKPSQFSSFLNV